jgi:ABC-type glycerol-3-phosphate transport system permease component
VPGKVASTAIIRWLIISVAVTLALVPLLFLLANSVKPSIEYFNSPRILPTSIDLSHFEQLLAVTIVQLRFVRTTTEYQA